MDTRGWLHNDRHRLARSFAEAVIPPGGAIPGADESTVTEALDILDDISARRGFDAALYALESLSLVATGRRFGELGPDAQQHLLEQWQQRRLAGALLSLVSLAYKGVHFDRPSVAESLGGRSRQESPATPARFLSRVIEGHRLGRSTTVECDVVIIGTGAGGAVVGRELARRGHAVVFVEEGRFFRRDAFTGSALDAKSRFYRDKGAVTTIGNTVIPTFMGRMVGGSTTINAGTCFRPPSWILEEWCERLETEEFAPEVFARHLEAIEVALGVETARAEHLGGLARVVRRGCERLGFSHGTVRRNAPDCTAEGCCDFGCPSGAKRSVDISMIPSALDRGALLYTGMTAEGITVDHGRAVGLVARSGVTGSRLRVKAQAVVVAGGAVQTPLLLLRQGLCNRSGEVGRNLSLHPMVYMSALFEEKICGHEAIPQSYYCDEFHRDGILLLGSSPPVSGAALVLPFVGDPLMKALERFDRVATLGILAEDQGRGRVRLVAGRPLLTYSLHRGDLERLTRGLNAAGEVLSAGGARELYPLLTRPMVLRGAAELSRFASTGLKARDFMVTSFHPLGTVAMGRDPRRSVVGLNHETHEVRQLYVVDGSTVPGPPAVNPQITIMAMAHRAAQSIGDGLS